MARYPVGFHANETSGCRSSGVAQHDSKLMIGFSDLKTIVQWNKKCRQKYLATKTIVEYKYLPVVNISITVNRPPGILILLEQNLFSVNDKMVLIKISENKV
jgi:hypothetical protein